MARGSTDTRLQLFFGPFTGIAPRACPQGRRVYSDNTPPNTLQANIADGVLAYSADVIALAPVGTAPEGIEFLKRGSRLFVLSANEAAGTVSVLEVVD